MKEANQQEANQIEKRVVPAAVNGQRGFTIMEVLIVLAIIALIMGVLVGPKIFGQAAEAKRRAAHTEAKQFATAYARWQLDHESRCPTSINELVKYMSKEGSKDPWGQEYTMVCGDQAPPESRGFGIASPGPDGNAGTDDDVKSWEKLKVAE